MGAGEELTKAGLAGFSEMGERVGIVGVEKLRV